MTEREELLEQLLRDACEIIEVKTSKSLADLFRLRAGFIKENDHE